LKLEISFCEFKDGTYDLYMVFDGHPVTLHGSTEKLSSGAKEILFNEVPPCVYTTFEKCVKEEDEIVI
jgi:hypothetical protein